MAAERPGVGFASLSRATPRERPVAEPVWGCIVTRQRSAARSTLSAPAIRPPGVIRALLLAEGIVVARPFVLDADVITNRRGSGFLSTLDGGMDVAFRTSKRWPTGRLRLVGALADPATGDAGGGFPRVEWADALPALIVHFAALLVPSGRVAAFGRWVARPDGTIRLDRRCEPTMYDDTVEDYAMAARASVWFREGLSSGGKSDGDGALWPGGVPHFLDDLWTALETLRAATGTAYGHDPASREFRSKMRGHPSERTLRDWLREAHLRPRDIASGEVTRTNYSQFVAK